MGIFKCGKQDGRKLDESDSNYNTDLHFLLYLGVFFQARLISSRVRPYPASLKWNNDAMVAVLASQPCLSLTISAKNSSLNLADGPFGSSLESSFFLLIVRPVVTALSYSLSFSTKYVSDRRPMNSFSPKPAPQTCPSRVEQSNKQHSALIVFNTSTYFLDCMFSRDSKLSPVLPSNCMVKTASDQNSLKASKKSQSIVLPSDTLPYRYSTASENLVNLDANLRLSSAEGPFLIDFSLLWASESILSNDGVSLCLMRVSAQQKRMAVYRWFEQKSLFTFQKSEMEALLEADRREPSFSLCFCNFSSSFTQQARNRQSECVSSCAWRLPSTIFEQNLLSSLTYSYCITYITIIAGKPLKQKY